MSNLKYVILPLSALTGFIGVFTYANTDWFDYWEMVSAPPQYHEITGELLNNGYCVIQYPYASPNLVGVNVTKNEHGEFVLANNRSTGYLKDSAVIKIDDFDYHELITGEQIEFPTKEKHKFNKQTPLTLTESALQQMLNGDVLYMGDTNSSTVYKMPLRGFKRAFNECFGE